MNKTVTILKQIINEEGISFIAYHAYEVYLKLLHENVDPREARLILLTLLSSVALHAPEKTEARLSQEIQDECCLKKDKADQLAFMYKQLFSEENQKEWRQKTEAGFREFCEEEWKFHWDAEKEWHKDAGYVVCTCNVEAQFEVSDQTVLRSALVQYLDDNPFITADKIQNILAEELGDLLNNSMQDYVDGDDYYEPWMEDYDCDDVLQCFARSHGLNMIDYSCDGDTSDWQSDRW